MAAGPEGEMGAGWKVFEAISRGGENNWLGSSEDTISAGGRRKIATALKARWAKVRAQQKKAA